MLELEVEARSAVGAVIRVLLFRYSSIYIRQTVASSARASGHTQ
jgi:hypothetical protein